MKTWQGLKKDPSLWENYFLREKVIKVIRLFFDERGFHEVETPILIPHPPAESYLEVFQTELLDRKGKPTPMYLSTSPEVALKKLMVAGIGNCYSLTKSFRNTEVGDRLHNPEFTILEWYRVGATYKDIMSDCENLLLYTINHIFPTTQRSNAVTISYDNQLVDLALPWPRISIKESFQKFSDIDLDVFLDIKDARRIAELRGYVVSEENTWEELFNQIFLNEVEPSLPHNKPVFLYDFPASVGALAKKKQSNPSYVERFELYVAGLEIADCYTELTDWKEQERRFDKEIGEIKRLGKTLYQYDHDFIDALKAGLPGCAGVALGVDRLLMLLLNTNDIANTLAFPIKELL